MCCQDALVSNDYRKQRTPATRRNAAVRTLVMRWIMDSYIVMLLQKDYQHKAKRRLPFDQDSLPSLKGKYLQSLPSTWHLLYHKTIVREEACILWIQ